MTYNITRNYGSDVSATQAKNMLNNIAREAGCCFRTPVASAKPRRPERNEFEIETRAGVDHLDKELGASEGSLYGVSYRVVGTSPSEDLAIVRVWEN